MALNINRELDEISRTLTLLVQDELRRKRLVDTGKLLNSIRVIPRQTSSGFTLKIEALDYFQYLDEKYNILEDAFKDSNFIKVQEQLVNLYNLIVIDELTKDK